MVPILPFSLDDLFLLKCDSEDHASLNGFIKWPVQLTREDNLGAISSPEPSDLMAAHDPKALRNSAERSQNLAIRIS